MLKKILPATLIFSSLVLAQTDTTLIFSEIMFYPTSGPNEFIELYNYSTTKSIDLNKYKIKYSTASPDIIMDAGEEAVLTGITHSDAKLGLVLLDMKRDNPQLFGRQCSSIPGLSSPAPQILQRRRTETCDTD